MAGAVSERLPASYTILQAVSFHGPESAMPDNHRFPRSLDSSGNHIDRDLGGLTGFRASDDLRIARSASHGPEEIKPPEGYLRKHFDYRIHAVPLDRVGARYVP